MPASAYLISTGCIDEKVSVFCGLVESSTIGKLGGMETENEETIVHVLDFATCLESLRKQRFSYAFTILALQWLTLHRDELRQAWC